MTCQELVDFLLSYVEDELAAATRSEFEAHLGQCPECDLYLEQYRQAVRMGREICAEPAAPVPEDVPETLVAAILAARRREGSG